MLKISGVGIDIVSINRIEKIYNKYKEKFTNKIFTSNEIQEAIEKGHFMQSLSGKFSAKEAFIKASNKKIYNLKDIEVLSNMDGKPYINFENKKYNLLSISHEKDYAIAVVIIQ